MIEYLVKRTDGEWFDFAPDTDPYRPVAYPYRKIESHGDSCIEIDGCKVSFSYEDPGVQVSFEGELSPQAAAVVAEEIRQRIQKVSG